MIEIIVSPQIAKKVANKYVYLRRKRRKETGVLYQIEKMHSNIESILSINGAFIDEQKIKEPILPEWKTLEYKVVKHKTWYFAIKLGVDKNGDTIAITIDAKYNADYFIKESVRRITQSDICRIVESAVRKYLHRQMLNEKFYNPATEPLIDGHVGEYEVLDGAEWEQILCDLPKKGWVEDIRMYSAMGKGGKTYCLYRRKDNGKYFFVEVFDDNKDDYLRVKQVRKNEVPIPIWNNAISLIRCS